MGKTSHPPASSQKRWRAFAPSTWRCNIDPAERRARLVVFVLCTLPLLVGYLWLSISVGAEYGVFVNAFCLSCVLGSGALLRWTSQERPAAVMFLTSCFVWIFGSSMLSGGLDSATLWLLPLVAMTTGLLLGARACLVASGVTFACLVLATYVHVHLPLEREYATGAHSTVVLRCVQLIFVAIIAKMVNDTAFTQLRRRQAVTQALSTASEVAQHADQKKSEFLAQISHELRTPMNAVLGSTQYLRMHSDLSPALRTTVDLIHENAERVLGNLNQSLYISQGDVNVEEEPLRRRAFSLTEVDIEESMGGDRPPRILVVDDLEINRKVVQLTLKKIGCDVEMACDGVQAVEVAMSQGFDLILMDLDMPQKDGFEATTEILGGRGPNRSTPIVALTASAEDVVKERCLAVGMKEHLSKPFRLADLQRCLETYASAQPSLSQGDARAA